MEYRNELKFVCSSSELDVLKPRLLSVMEPDPHMDENLQYNIRSVYFDDWQDSFMYENEAGFNDRMKVRIRIYNGSDSIIKLELKYKLNGLTKKRSANITRELCDRLIRGEKITLAETRGNPVLNLLYVYMQTKLLQPKVIVEYDRTVFINHFGNVRITFDKNIRCSAQVDRLFEKNIMALPVLETGLHVLEVKYDELLPDYIGNVVNTGNLTQTAFSKYYLSRLALQGRL